MKIRRIEILMCMPLYLKLPVAYVCPDCSLYDGNTREEICGYHIYYYIWAAAVYCVSENHIIQRTDTQLCSSNFFVGLCNWGDIAKDSCRLGSGSLSLGIFQQHHACRHVNTCAANICV